MNIDLIPFAAFAVVTTFTPGPNNISSASMGVLYGYRKTLHYLTGIASGFFLVMLLCAYLATSLFALLPAAEPVLRVAGSLYILWLAYGAARASYGFNGKDQSPLGFKKGFFLQAFNPKVLVYGLTIYSTFLSSIAGNYLALSLFALLLAGNAFCATSTWALCGAAIRSRLQRSKVKLLVNTALVLLLIYTAIDLSGITAW